MTVLIVDDNRVWCSVLSQALDKEEAYSLLIPVHDGKDALDTILQSQPDIVVLDILLPVFDGLYILQYIRTHLPDYKPFVYVVSVLAADHAMHLMQDLGVHYCSIKPVSTQTIVSNLAYLLKGHTAPKKATDTPHTVRYALDIDQIVSDYLHEIGAPLYRISTNCGHAAIKAALLDESRLENITEIYRNVALACTPPTTPGAVERNIRSLVKNIRTKSSSAFIHLFAHRDSKLSNTEFLSNSVYILRQRIGDAMRK